MNDSISSPSSTRDFKDSVPVGQGENIKKFPVYTAAFLAAILSPHEQAVAGSAMNMNFDKAKVQAVAEYDIAKQERIDTCAQLKKVLEDLESGSSVADKVKAAIAKCDSY